MYQYEKLVIIKSLVKGFKVKKKVFCKIRTGIDLISHLCQSFLMLPEDKEHEDLENTVDFKNGSTNKGIKTTINQQRRTLKLETILRCRWIQMRLRILGQFVQAIGGYVQVHQQVRIFVLINKKKVRYSASGSTQLRLCTCYTFQIIYKISVLNNIALHD